MISFICEGKSYLVDKRLSVEMDCVHIYFVTHAQ